MFVTQYKFLSNIDNKKKIYIEILTGNALEIKQTSDDSGPLIGIEKSQTLTTVIVRQDIDLLLLPTDKKKFFLKYKIGKIPVTYVVRAKKYVKTFSK